MSRTGAEILIDALVAQGTRVIFGYPGGAVMPIYDALHGAGNAVRHVLTRHEQGAVHAAQGYARASGLPGVCLATSGPGATNFITGLTDALMDSTPLVCIVGQVHSDLLGTDAFQEADVIGLTLSATKWSRQVVDAREMESTVARAFEIARAGRPGPVLIEVTRDAQMQMVDDAPGFEVPGFEVAVPGTMDTAAAPLADDGLQRAMHDQLQRAANAINGAKRPYFLIGHGVTIAGAEAAAMQVAARTGMPVASTLLGLSAFPVDHPQYVGMLGMHGAYAANLMTNEADVILAVGMRFDDRVTGRLNDYAPDAEIIHVDVDASQIGRLVPVAVGLVADAKDALTQMLPHLEPREHLHWLARCRTLRAMEREAVIDAECDPAGGPMRMGEVVSHLSARTAGRATIVSDVGQHQMAAARYYAFETEGGHITSGGLGTMGFALPAALGAQVGTPLACVVAIIGDGGFQMNLQELATVAQERLPLKIVILNNEHLGMVRQWQELFFDGRYSSVDLPSPDFVMIARGFGVDGERVDERESLAGAMDRMLEARGPYLLDIRVAKADNVFPMIATGASVSEMRLC